MSPLTGLPGNPETPAKRSELNAIISATNAEDAALAKRLAAVEAKVADDVASLADLRAELAARRTADRLAELEAKSLDAFAHVAENTDALRAILTLLHPDDEHPPVTNEIVPNGEWLHELVMYWIARYGGRVEEGETL